MLPSGNQILISILPFRPSFWRDFSWQHIFRLIERFIFKKNLPKQTFSSDFVLQLTPPPPPPPQYRRSRDCQNLLDKTRAYYLRQMLSNFFAIFSPGNHLCQLACVNLGFCAAPTVKRTSIIAYDFQRNTCNSSIPSCQQKKLSELYFDLMHNVVVY